MVASVLVTVHSLEAPHHEQRNALNSDVDDKESSRGNVIVNVKDSALEMAAFDLFVRILKIFSLVPKELERVAVCDLRL
jgi:hypothetical protein